MRTQAQLITPHLKPDGFGAAWRGLPRVILIYVGTTAVGLAGYVGIQYATGLFDPAKPVEAKHPDSTPPTPPPAMIGQPSAPSTLPLAPVSNPVPGLATDAAAIAAADPHNLDAVLKSSLLSEVIASALQRKETVVQIVREEQGDRYTVQIVRTPASDGFAQPKVDEYVTFGPLLSNHDKGWSPDSDGSVKHVVFLTPTSGGDTPKPQANAADANSTIEVPPKYLHKLPDALKPLDKIGYSVVVKFTNPAEKSEVQARLTQ